MARYSLGLDCSTQSLSATILDIDSREVVYEYGVNYLTDPRLSDFSLNADYLLEPGERGEANQPVLLFVAALDSPLFDLHDRLSDQGVSMNEIVVINVSGQQHGHILLSSQAALDFDHLTYSAGELMETLSERLENSSAVPFARIWRTSCTAEQAALARDRVGGKRAMIELSGSDAPLRFSAFGIRKTAEDFASAYQRTTMIHQISSFLPAVLTGTVHVPLDFGNACGSGLMDYRKREWSGPLLEAVGQGISGGAEGLRSRLPRLDSAQRIVGNIAAYYIDKYALDPLCRVCIGSGDNPQTKVLVNGSLLSLGTSFVMMVQADGETFDFSGSANAMYDALDRPFMFGCRTNGALRWDNVRESFGLNREEYQPAEAALAQTPVGNNGRIFLWQAEAESFPVTGSCELRRIGYGEPELAADYTGVIESSLASVYLHSRGFTADDKQLYIAGGPSQSPGILRRVAAIWNRQVVPVRGAGAALGTAASGATAYLNESTERVDAGEYCGELIGQGDVVDPDPADVQAIHGSGGLLNRLAQLERDVLGIDHPEER